MQTSSRQLAESWIVLACAQPGGFVPCMVSESEARALTTSGQTLAPTFAEHLNALLATW